MIDDITTCDENGHWDVWEIKLLCDYRDRLRQENERLRSALQDLADCCGHDDDKALLLALRNAAKALAPCSRTPQSEPTK